MPNSPDRNPSPELSRLVKKSDAARIIGVKRQFIPVMIGMGQLETEEVAGTLHVTRASAEAAAEKRRQRNAARKSSAA